MSMDRLRFCVLLVCLALGSRPAATAQSLPDWAAPSSPPPTFEEPPAEAVPTLPGDPTQVPIDGGLGLLALLGVGYAARKLRTQRSEEG
ncbi:MAG: hypothetical protein AAFP18_07940 [Bacteroidota bacterium]